MEKYSARSLLLRVLIGCLVAAVAAAQTPIQLKVFRGTLVHSRVRTEMEILEDYLIGIDENNYGTVGCGIHTYSVVGETFCMSIPYGINRSRTVARSP